MRRGAEEWLLLLPRRMGNGEHADRNGEIQIPDRTSRVVHDESEVDALAARKGRIQSESERRQVVATRRACRHIGIRGQAGWVM
jgi:hypothetical protein